MQIIGEQMGQVSPEYVKAVDVVNPLVSVGSQCLCGGLHFFAHALQMESDSVRLILSRWRIDGRHQHERNIGVLLADNLHRADNRRAKGTRAQTRRALDVNAEAHRDIVRRQLANHPRYHGIEVTLAAIPEAGQVEAASARDDGGPGLRRRCRLTTLRNRTAVGNPAGAAIGERFYRRAIVYLQIAQLEDSVLRQPQFNQFHIGRQVFKGEGVSAR